MRRLVLASGLLVWAALLAGCTSASEATSAPPTRLVSTPVPTTAQQEVIAALLAADDATPTMSDSQRAILLEALAGVEITFEQYQEAVSNTLRCAADAGLLIDGPQTVDRGGQNVVDWGWSDPRQPDGNPKLGEYCRNIHSFGIEQAYLNSDIALETERKQLEEWRPGIVACYAESGAPLSDPGADIYALLNDVDAFAGDQAETVTNCIAELSIVLGHAP